jgi:hypothetical protein
LIVLSPIEDPLCFADALQNGISTNKVLSMHLLFPDESALLKVSAVGSQDCGKLWDCAFGYNLVE